jgi:hypothetical protein
MKHCKINRLLVRRVIPVMMIVLVNGLLPARAQEDGYTVTLGENVQALDTATTVQALTGLATTFGALYEAKKDWLPLYYECLTSLRLSYAYADADRKEAALRQAEQQLSALPAGNDEVLVLRADFAMTILGVHQERWQQYLPMLNESLQQAEALNPENPRIYYLKGKKTYYMPAAMGGGKDAGLAILRVALEKYKAFRPKETYAPSWGREEVEKFLNGEIK